MEEAKAQFAAFAAAAAGYAHKAGIRLAIEPLGWKEGNFIHTVSEALEIRRMAGEPEGLYVLGDLYHMHMNDEDFSGILAAGPVLAHCHIASPVKRQYCAAGQADDFYAGFFAALKDIGYEGGVSLEGVCEDMARDLPLSIAYMRTLA